MKLLLSVCLLLSVQLLHAQSRPYLVLVNKAENNASLIDLATGQPLKKIEVGHGPHEAAAAPSGRLVAVSNYGDGGKMGNSISIIDMVAGTKIKDIDLGVYKRPHGMEYISEDILIATSEVNQVLLLVNTKTNEVTELANTSQKGSHMVDYSPLDKMAYTANVFDGTVSVIDVAGKQLSNVINLKQGIEGLAVSPDGKELWVANRNDSSVTIINTTTKEKIAVLPTGQLPYRVAFHPAGDYVFIANAVSSTIGMYDAKQRKVLREIDLQSAGMEKVAPLGLTVSADGKYLYATVAGSPGAVEIEIATGKLIRWLEGGKGPDGICHVMIG